MTRSDKHGHSVAKPKTVFMFAGQGSQYFQMGQSLYHQNRIFRECMHEMDTIVRELCGHSVVDVLYAHGHTKSETFDRILLSHPAIFMVEFATAKVLLAAGVEPNLTLGVSIGAFTSVAVAGCLSVEDALVALIRQSSMIEACCARGGMLAVLHDTKLLDEPNLWTDTEVAAVNLPTHFVVSGTCAALQRIATTLESRGVTTQRLPIPYAFHSSGIDAAGDTFRRFAQSFTRKSAALPIVSPLHPEIITEIPDDFLWRVVREPIRLFEAFTHLESLESFRYVDVGPTSTLSAIARKVANQNGPSDSTANATLSPFGADLKNIEALIVSDE